MCPGASAASSDTILVSEGDPTLEMITPNGTSYGPGLSADGRYAVFGSFAINVIPNDADVFSDVYMRDMVSGQVTRVSVNSVGEPLIGDKYEFSMSSDGRYVAFDSTGGGGSEAGVYVRDAVKGTTTFVSQGDQPSISADGRYVALLNKPWNSEIGEIVVWDSRNNSLTRKSTYGGIFDVTISADGRFVPFASRTALVSGDTNGAYDVFVWDFQSGSTVRASVSDSGAEANGDSLGGHISADGQFVVFISNASNLVPGDTNSMSDIFVRDLESATTTRVNLDHAIREPNGSIASRVAISADGRHVVFDSGAINLVPGDDNQSRDVFVYDLETNDTARVSVGSGGEQGNGQSELSWISADGRLVGFQSIASNFIAGDDNVAFDTFVRDTQSNTTSLVSIRTAPLGASGISGPSYIGTLSADGRFIAFSSYAVNLAPNTRERRLDVYVRDALNGTTKRVSVDADGNQSDGSSSGPSISADGRFVAFSSHATNLVENDTNQHSDVFVRDVLNENTTRISVNSNGGQVNSHNSSASISADGRYVAFQSDARRLVPDKLFNQDDVFLRDIQAGTTTRVSVNTEGADSNHHSYGASISDNGRYVAFVSEASNLVEGDTNGDSDVFVRDTVSGITTRVSVNTQGAEADRDSSSPTISADGRYVAYASDATNLVQGDSDTSTDVFLHDRQTGTTIRVGPVGPDIEFPGRPSVSADGRYVAFGSFSDGLVANDTNGVSDLFVRDIHSGKFTRVSVASDGLEANDASRFGVMSRDGRYVAFSSEADNLVADDLNGEEDVFLADISGIDDFPRVPATVAATGTNAGRKNNLNDTLEDGSQNLGTSWRNDDSISSAWFTLDLGSEHSVYELRIAPRGDATISLPVTVGNALNDGKVVGGVTTSCARFGPGSTVPTHLHRCYLAANGRYVTVQGDRNRLQVHGMEVYGVPEEDLVSQPVPAYQFDLHPETLSVDFDGSASSDPNGSIGDYAWDFGDGTTAAGPVASHQYAEEGQYRVTLTVTNDRGVRATKSRRLSVYENGLTYLGASIEAVGSNEQFRGRIVDRSGTAQDLSTSWSNEGVAEGAWFTLDLGASRSIGELRFAPRADRNYNLSVTIADSLSGGKATGPSAGVCAFTAIDGISTSLRPCAVGGQGRYITVQESAGRWLTFHGVEVLGIP
jgi:hypothetical protein